MPGQRIAQIFFQPGERFAGIFGTSRLLSASALLVLLISLSSFGCADASHARAGMTSPEIGDRLTAFISANKKNIVLDNTRNIRTNTCRLQPGWFDEREKMLELIMLSDDVAGTHWLTVERNVKIPSPEVIVELTFQADTDLKSPDKTVGLELMVITNGGGIGKIPLGEYRQWGRPENFRKQIALNSIPVSDILQTKLISYFPIQNNYVANIVRFEAEVVAHQ